EFRRVLFRSGRTGCPAQHGEARPPAPPFPRLPDAAPLPRINPVIRPTGNFLMKRILIRSGKSPFDVVSPEQVIQHNIIGTNAGHLIFSDAVHKILYTERAEITSNRFVVHPSAADRITEEYDVFVVPLANAFRPSFEKHLRTLTELIERLTIPVVVFGVGAQSGLDYNPERLAPLERTVKRFAAAVLDRSP